MPACFSASPGSSFTTVSIGGRLEGTGGGEVPSSITTRVLEVLGIGRATILPVFRTLEGSLSILEVVSKSRKKVVLDYFVFIITLLLYIALVD